MGLFGKDDRKPASPQPGPQQPRASHSTSPAPSREVTVIGRGSRFEGKVTGSADMLVEGTVVGSVDSGARITVAEPGEVKANLHGRVVVIAGSVTGDVSADEKIELHPSATLKGNITAPRILIQEGATFEGEVRMAKPEKKATANAPKRPEKARPSGGGSPPGPSKGSRKA